MRAARPRAILVALMAAFAGEAAAGAWTQEPGQAFVSASISRFETDDGAFAETTQSVFAEYGVLPWLTLGGQLEFGQPDDGDGPEEVRVNGLVRARLRTGDAGDPLSVQVGFGQNVGDLTTLAPGRREDEAELDLRLAYGRGVSGRLGPGWLNAEGGVRFQFGDGADELRLDLTAGVRPAPRWLAFAQSFTTLGLSNEAPGGADFSVTKAAVSAGYEITERATLVLGVERDLVGRNIREGTRGRLSLWLRF